MGNLELSITDSLTDSLTASRRRAHMWMIPLVMTYMVYFEAVCHLIPNRVVPNVRGMTCLFYFEFTSMLTKLRREVVAVSSASAMDSRTSFLTFSVYM